MKIFGKISPFFLLDTLTSFDTIVGFDLLTQAGVALNLQESTLKYLNRSEQLQYHNCESVNFTDVKDIVVPSLTKKELKAMILKRLKAFSTSNEALPFNTSVIVTIRTIDNEPVYSKL